MRIKYKQTWNKDNIVEESVEEMMNIHSDEVAQRKFNQRVVVKLIKKLVEKEILNKKEVLSIIKVSGHEWVDDDEKKRKDMIQKLYSQEAIELVQDMIEKNIVVSTEDRELWKECIEVCKEEGIWFGYFSMHNEDGGMVYKLHKK